MQNVLLLISCIEFFFENLRCIQAVMINGLWGKQR